jgi:hypothetical protein
MSSVRFNARLDASHHGPSHAFKENGVVVGSLTGIHSAMVKCLFVVNRSCIKGLKVSQQVKNPVDLNLSSLEATLWVLLYLYTGHDTCY